MTEIEKRLIKKNGSEGKVYGDLVNKLIRKKYSLSEELAILRQREEKPEEFMVYNAFVEECKNKAKEEMNF